MYSQRWSVTTSHPRVGLLEGVDLPTAVRAGSTAFSILLVGGLLSPLMATWAPIAGGVCLGGTAVAAFIVAGCRIGRARRPVVHGAVAASLGYLLVLPLVLLHPLGRDASQISLTLLCAVVVGGLAGRARHRVQVAHRHQPNA